MDFSIECIDKGDYLLLQPAGPWTQATGRQIVDTVSEKTAETGIRKILLDMRQMSAPDSDFTRFMGGKYLAEKVGSGVRIAALSLEENVTYFAETVARNRGANLRVFIEEQAAMQWLLQ